MKELIQNNKKKIYTHGVAHVSQFSTTSVVHCACSQMTHMPHHACCSAVTRSVVNLLLLSRTSLTHGHEVSLRVRSEIPLWRDSCRGMAAPRSCLGSSDSDSFDSLSLVAASTERICLNGSGRTMDSSEWCDGGTVPSFRKNNLLFVMMMLFLLCGSKNSERWKWCDKMMDCGCVGCSG